MTLKDWQAVAVKLLQEADVPSARLDCLVLLEDCLNMDRTLLLAHPEIELTNHQRNKLNRQVAKRAKHEPLAYIRGFSEFYGRRFRVNKHVLEPRPESETMIELLKRLGLSDKPIIADVGTGSGALGITTVLEIHDAQADLYDIDSNCLAVAKHNAVMHELHLHVYKRDLLSRPARNYDAVLANLPYVPTNWAINSSAALEPRLAIYGGKDGLDVYRRLFAQLQKQHAPPNFVLTEALPPQHDRLSKIAEDFGYKLQVSRDFIQVFAFRS